jgi:hypothetical protein
MDHETRSSDTHRMNASASGACSVWTVRAVMRIRIGNLPPGRCTITTVARSDKNGMPDAWLAFSRLYVARGPDVMLLSLQVATLSSRTGTSCAAKMNYRRTRNVWPVLTRLRTQRELSPLGDKIKQAYGQRPGCIMCPAAVTYPQARIQCPARKQSQGIIL